MGDNRHHGSFAGYPSGDTLYLLLADGPTRFTFTTCSSLTTFDTYLRLYDQCPGLSPNGHGHNLTVEDPDVYCS